MQCAHRGRGITLKDITGQTLEDQNGKAKLTKEPKSATLFLRPSRLSQVHLYVESQTAISSTPSSPLAMEIFSSVSYVNKSLHIELRRAEFACCTCHTQISNTGLRLEHSPLPEIHFNAFAAPGNVVILVTKIRVLKTKKFCESGLQIHTKKKINKDQLQRWRTFLVVSMFSQCRESQGPFTAQGDPWGCE